MNYSETNIRENKDTIGIIGWKKICREFSMSEPFIREFQDKVKT